MNCQWIQDNLATYLEGLFEPAEQQRFEAHLETCGTCCETLAEARRLHERLVARGTAHRAVSLEDRVLREIQQREDTQPRRLMIMFKRYGKATVGFSAAAAILLAVTLFWGMGAKEASAAQLFKQAIAAVSNLHSMHMKLRIRTLPRDNFAYIGLDSDFVAHEIWKEFGETPKYRVEKPGRTVVMDGTQTVCVIRPNIAFKFGPGSGAIEWLEHLLYPDQLLDLQLKAAEKNGWPLEMTRKADENGAPKIVVAIEVKAQGDYTNDYLKNKSIGDADTRRIYTFDAATNLLEKLQVYVHAADKDVLVLETTLIEYDTQLEPSLFVPDLPADVQWFQPTQVLPDNEKYQQMGPQESARAFFEAMAGGNWEEVGKFLSMPLPPQVKEYLAGLTIVSIGEPFQSGRYPGWFVPYEIRFKDGQVKKHNLAVRNDNPAKRYVVDGGF